MRPTATSTASPFALMVQSLALPLLRLDLALPIAFTFALIRRDGAHTRRSSRRGRPRSTRSETVRIAATLLRRLVRGGQVARGRSEVLLHVRTARIAPIAAVQEIHLALAVVTLEAASPSHIGVEPSEAVPLPVPGLQLRQAIHQPPTIGGSGQLRLRMWPTRPARRAVQISVMTKMV